MVLLYPVIIPFLLKSSLYARISLLSYHTETLHNSIYILLYLRVPSLCKCAEHLQWAAICFRLREYGSAQQVNLSALVELTLQTEDRADKQATASLALQQIISFTEQKNELSFLENNLTDQP